MYGLLREKYEFEVFQRPFIFKLHSVLHEANGRMYTRHKLDQHIVMLPLRYIVSSSFFCFVVICQGSFLFQTPFTLKVLTNVM